MSKPKGSSDANQIDSVSTNDNKEVEDIVRHYASDKVLYEYRIIERPLDLKIKKEDDDKKTD